MAGGADDGARCRRRPAFSLLEPPVVTSAKPATEAEKVAQRYIELMRRYLAHLQEDTKILAKQMRDKGLCLTEAKLKAMECPECKVIYEQEGLICP
jgi:hypothetical protein